MRTLITLMLLALGAVVVVPSAQTPTDRACPTAGGIGFSKSEQWEAAAAFQQAVDIDNSSSWRVHMLGRAQMPSTLRCGFDAFLRCKAVSRKPANDSRTPDAQHLERSPDRDR